MRRNLVGVPCSALKYANRKPQMTSQSTMQSASFRVPTHPDRTAKIVLLGEAAVGKSSLAARFVRNEFLPTQESTIGAAFLSHTVSTAAGSVKLEIWDTAGQERYRSLAPMYYRGAVAALVVYDITSAESLKRSQSWIQELRRNGCNALIALLGNKCDLAEKRVVPQQQGQEIAAEEGAMFYETSAKNGDNVETVFRAVAERIIAEDRAPAARPTGGEPPGARKGSGVKPGKKTQEKKSCPCAK